MMEEIRSLIAQGKTVTITAKGNSMNPFIANGRDQITLGPWKKEDVVPGCVALVKDTRGIYLIHRVVKVEQNHIVLLGDGNVAQYEKAEFSQIIGLMKSICRKGKTYESDSFVWRTYSLIWKWVTPVRRYPLGLWRRLHRNLLFVRK